MNIRSIGTLATAASLVTMMSCGKKSDQDSTPPQSTANDQTIYYAIDAKTVEDIDSRIKTNLGVTASWTASIAINGTVQQAIDKKAIGDVIAMLKDKKFRTVDEVKLALTVRNAANAAEVLATNERESIKNEAQLTQIYDSECKDISSLVYKFGQYDHDSKGQPLLRVQMCDLRNVFTRPNVTISAQPMSYVKKTRSYSCPLVNNDKFNNGYYFLQVYGSTNCAYGYRKLPDETAPDLSYRAGEEVGNGKRTPYLSQYFSLSFDRSRGLEPIFLNFGDTWENPYVCHTINVTAALDNPDTTYRLTLKLKDRKWELSPYYSVETLTKYRQAMLKKTFSVDILCDWYATPQDTIVPIVAQ